MRDVIWTLIVIWLVYRLVDVFKRNSTKKGAEPIQSNTSTDLHQNGSTAQESEIKKALKKQLNEEGEYVDFEEIK
jgi:hypothetical protein